MFLTAYFTSVRVPDSATCHLRTPSSTRILIPSSLHLFPHPQLPSPPSSPPPGFPRSNLNPNPSYRSPSWRHIAGTCSVPSRLWPTAHCMARHPSGQREIQPVHRDHAKKMRETAAHRAHSGRESLLRNAGDLTSNPMSHRLHWTDTLHNKNNPKNDSTLKTGAELSPASIFSSDHRWEEAPRSDETAAQDDGGTPSVMELGECWLWDLEVGEC